MMIVTDRGGCDDDGDRWWWLWWWWWQMVVVVMIVTVGGGCDDDSDRWWWLWWWWWQMVMVVMMIVTDGGGCDDDSATVARSHRSNFGSGHPCYPPSHIGCFEVLPSSHAAVGRWLSFGGICSSSRWTENFTVTGASHKLELRRNSRTFEWRWWWWNRASCRRHTSWKGRHGRRWYSRILLFGTTWWCCAPSQFFLTALLELAEGTDGPVDLELDYVNHRPTLFAEEDSTCTPILKKTSHTSARSHPGKDLQNTWFLGAHPWGSFVLPP